VRTAGAAALLALALSGCSGSSSQPASTTASAWKPGDAVAVLIADVTRGPSGDPVDFGQFADRPGVIAVYTKGDTLRLSLSRKALLTDLASLRLELERTEGLSNVREVFVPPS
jgi:hypothetical protein